jgi:plastocyanin
LEQSWDRNDSKILKIREVLEAQQQLLPAENALAQTQLNQLVVIVRLYKALGGGWNLQDDKWARPNGVKATYLRGDDSQASKERGESMMMKRKAFLGCGMGLLVLAVCSPVLAATVKVTSTALEPATITVGRGEEIVWVDATITRTANVDVALHFGKQPGAHVTMTKDGNVRVRFDEPGTYEYHVNIGAGGWGPLTLDGKIVVK